MNSRIPSWLHEHGKDHAGKMLPGQYLGHVLEVSDQLDCLQLNAGFSNSAFCQYLVQHWFAQACFFRGLPTAGLVSSQRMNLRAFLLVKEPTRQGYQAAGHLHSQMRVGNVLRRLFAA